MKATEIDVIVWPMIIIQGYTGTGTTAIDPVSHSVVQVGCHHHRLLIRDQLSVHGCK